SGLESKQIVSRLHGTDQHPPTFFGNQKSAILRFMAFTITHLHRTIFLFSKLRIWGSGVRISSGAPIISIAYVMFGRTRESLGFHWGSKSAGKIRAINPPRPFGVAMF